jgi:pimeloyl-ACP methyl ester carboxylesterase
MSPLIDTGNVSLFYEESGTGDRTLLLIPGRGGQLTDFHDDLVAAFVAQGFRVIRIDNRDAGLSDHFDGVVVANVIALMQGAAAPPYALDDMGDDAAGLLRALDIKHATVVGHSLGAMIAQCLAIRHPELVDGLVLIAGTTGAPGIGLPNPEILQTLMSSSPPQDAPDEDPVEKVVRSSARWMSTDLGMTEEDLRKRIQARFDRRYDSAGVARHVAAIAAAKDRTASLQSLDIPTVVMHGREDPLVGFDGGEALVAAVPNAEFIPVDMMRHDLPRVIWPDIVSAAERVSRG